MATVRCSISRSILTSGGRGRWRRCGRALLSAMAIAVAGARTADAHAFGARYDLPLPLQLYLLGAGGIVLLSFVVLAFLPRTQALPGHWTLPLPAWLPPRWRRSLRRAAAAFAIGIFLLVLVAGLAGQQSATGNIAPLIVWVLWWIGFLFLCVLLGNLWPLFNPWNALYRLGRSLCRRARPVEESGPPAGGERGGWLAALLFFLFAWLELVSHIADSPRQLAIAILCFSALTWAGMAWLGPQRWLAGFDPFHRVFALIGRFAPLGRDCAGRLVLRPPGAGLLAHHPDSLGGVAFIVLLLASVTFDGFSETPLWLAALDFVANSQTLRPALLWLQGQGLDLLVVVKTLGLLAAASLFLLLFAGVCRLSLWAGGGGVSTAQAMRRFAPSLLPIAIAYHLSHYLSYLLLAGQLALPLASDPLGLGWDLFGTRGTGIDVSVIGARTVWYVAVVAIVTGHVLSVVLAHLEAQRLFRHRRAAVASQLPMLALMIGFTMCSLWILSQPIVQDGG